jgi:FtsP/CotA-like multicopper oxidase with cupredoxin domain
MRKTAVNVVVGVVTVAAAVLVGWIAWLWYDSLLPDTYSVMDHGALDYGGGHVPEGGHHEGAGIPVTDLHGPATGPPDRSFTLAARAATVKLASGRTVEGLTFDGRSPGPELRVRQGDLVQVVLRNEDVAQGVTIHWHGVDVPNAEDGVAGVTQNAVLPGERHVYRFRAEQVGTFWYHSHQVSSEEVRRGLFGALVIEPPATSTDGRDLVIAAHTFDGIPTLNGSDVPLRTAVPPGTRVRLRLVNTDGAAHDFAVSGTPFRVVAIDGTDLDEPSPLTDVAVEVPGGGRADLALTAPRTPVWVTLDESRSALALNAADDAAPIPAAAPEVFDPLGYGRPEKSGVGPDASFDRRFELSIGRKLGFFDGRPGRQWTINGQIYPDVPVFVVEEGDLVHVTIENHSNAVHPMHLHGHHVLVLSRDGVPASGSTWWVDTLNVKPDERYEVALRADNPGLWMDHCHNLPHAADGLTMHVSYAGVTTPFYVGGEHHNAPE